MNAINGSLQFHVNNETSAWLQKNTPYNPVEKNHIHFDLMVIMGIVLLLTESIMVEKTHFCKQNFAVFLTVNRSSLLKKK